MFTLQAALFALCLLAVVTAIPATVPAGRSAALATPFALELLKRAPLAVLAGVLVALLQNQT